MTSIFTKLGLLPAADDHRRVLAVLAFLRDTKLARLTDDSGDRAP